MAALVRPAIPADAEAVAGIFAHYVMTSVATFEETPPTPEYWRGRLGDLAGGGLPVLVAETGGTVAGFAYASPWRPKPAYRYTVEDTVYLAPESRGQGLGRRLLEQLLEACAAAGVRQVIAVIADTGDPASETLHRTCGFTDAGLLREVGRKHGRWIDTLLLQRSVSPR